MESKEERIDTASKVIKAPVHHVYLAFLDPKAVTEWRPPVGMECEVYEFNPHVGGTYLMAFKYKNAKGKHQGETSRYSDVFRGKFVELIEDHKIVEQIKFESNEPGFADEMTITTRFSPVKEGTEVTFIADNVPEIIKKEDHESGMRSTLNNLAKFTAQ